MIQGLPFGLLLRIALRNLLAHKVKTIIVAMIVLAGTVLVVLGNSLLDSMSASMQRSITTSLAGHIQVYSADAEDELALFGSMVMGSPDLGVIEDFSKLKAVLEAVPNVKAVVPEALDGSIVYAGNILDRQLAKLRDAVEAKDPAREQALIGHVRQIIAVLREDMANLQALASEEALSQDERAALERAASDEFWAAFGEDPLASLEFLENKVAPLALSESMEYFAYIGTDLDAFAETFERFHLVEGQRVPPGRRGMLVNRFFREDRLKMRVARRLDLIQEARKEEGRSLADDVELQEWVRMNVAQHKELLLELDPTELPAILPGLTALLAKDGAAPQPDATPKELVSAFLDVKESNVDERTAFFYETIAPHVPLYSVDVGSTLTLTAFTRGGYVKSVNVPIYGVFAFEGLEKSGLAGFNNLVDLMTFRDLFGYRTEADRSEIEAIKAAVGVEDIGREDAEDALFGGDEDGDAAPEPIVERRPADGFDEFAGVDLTRREVYDSALFEKVYTKEDIEGGVVLNAAVVLEDPERIEETIAAIRSAADAAGMKLNVVDWQKAAGLAGNMIEVVTIVLYVAIFIIFSVAIVIINNSLVMATMERVREIGTLRAIGARRGLVLWMLLTESTVLTGVFGLLGAIVGAGIVLGLGSAGLPAGSEMMQFFFAGKYLYPFLLPAHIVIALVIMFVVSAISTAYPAWVATRITPLEAMQKED